MVDAFNLERELAWEKKVENKPREWSQEAV